MYCTVNTVQYVYKAYCLIFLIFVDSKCLFGYRLLLQHGAIVDEDTPAQFADCPTPISTAAALGREAVLRLLLDKTPSSINVIMPDTFWTPLMFSAAAGSKPVAQLLLDRGADPDRLNALNDTALDIAYQCEQPEIKAFLEVVMKFY